MALQLTAVYDPDTSTETLDCYTAVQNDDESDSIDFWFPKGAKPTSMDIFVEFEGITP